ncbi:hypothetical protein BJV78DRAFT_1194180, partial [Lactifluus subvellereus]
LTKFLPSQVSVSGSGPRDIAKQLRYQQLRCRPWLAVCSSGLDGRHWLWHWYHHGVTIIYS